MVLTDFSFIDDDEPTRMLRKFPSTPDLTSSSMENPSVATVSTTVKSYDVNRVRRVKSQATRIKSYSETGVVLEKLVQTKARPYSAGDAEDLRRVCISGFSKNKHGKWTFKVDVGTDELNSYAVRRRFSDFKDLHVGLAQLAIVDELPELPHHGIYSVVQMYLSPEPALTERAKKLEELLQFINSHPRLSRSAPYTKFIGKKPSSLELGYVSLSCYEAPTSDSYFQISSSRGYREST